MSNLTAIKGIENIFDIVSVANTISVSPNGTEGVLFGLFLIIFAFMLIMNLQSKTTLPRSIVITSFVCLIISLILRALELINILFIFLFAIGTALGLLYLYATND